MFGRKIVQTVSSQRLSRRWLQTTASRWAITNLEMPAMSPTMTEGGISQWKKKEGESFASGDVLLEIETDKATIDVEAQDDGVMGKILAPDGTKGIPIGKVIALLAEEGDDISNLQAPPESKPPPPKPSAEPSPPQSPPPSSTPDKFQPTPSTPPAPPQSHIEPSSSRPLFPSVIRLLSENNISQADEIKGTGVRGMLTKGDVLTYLGKASGPLGTYQAALDKEEQEHKKVGGAPEKKKEEAPAPLDGPALRRLIVGNMLASSIKARSIPVSKEPVDFDSIIADYLPPKPKSPPTPSTPSPSKPKTNPSGFPDGLF